MDFRIVVEWDEGCGLSLSKTYPLREGLEKYFQRKDYGSSVEKIGILLVCRDIDYKQRKRFDKGDQLLTYDVLLDFHRIKNAEVDEKKKIIRQQMIDVTEELFKKYKFENFDKDLFLANFKEITNSVEW